MGEYGYDYSPGECLIPDTEPDNPLIQVNQDDKVTTMHFAQDHVDRVIHAHCTCVWGYEDGHDYCAEPGADCPIHVVTDPEVEALLAAADERDRQAVAA